MLQSFAEQPNQNKMYIICIDVRQFYALKGAVLSNSSFVRFVKSISYYPKDYFSLNLHIHYMPVQESASRWQI